MTLDVSVVSRPSLIENAVTHVRGSFDQLIGNVKNLMSNIIFVEETDIDEMKEEVWADLSAVYYKYEVEDQKRAFREVTHEIAEKIVSGKWDNVYKKLYRFEQRISK